MKVLYIGDIVGSFGRRVTASLLETIRNEYRADVVLAQAENVTHGRGIKIEHYHALRKLGIDGFMSGNHIFALPEINSLLEDAQAPITRPANYPEAPGKQYKILPTQSGSIALISLLGQIVGKDADVPVDNPLHVIDAVLREPEVAACKVKVMNFHGDYSSEKVVIGQYLDGRVAASIGDHWHVPSADGRVLPGGTAHMSDVGMVGARNSSLGVQTDIIVKRWRGEGQGRNELEDSGEYQFCAACVTIDEKTGLATKIEQILRFGKL